ncbi:MAG: flavin reductase family protein [Planctomycetota bacterium]|nr:flavin reductase family protein [Planctomycetota bacterium]
MSLHDRQDQGAMKIDPSQLGPKENYLLLISAIVPRPIAFVSTQGRGGALNLAPFSFFMGVSTDPPTVAISVGRRKGEKKDTSQNIADTGEFVVNVVDESVAKRMVQSSGDFPPDVDEFAITGLTPAPSERVRPPRVAECKVSLECREVLTVLVGRKKQSLILGQILMIHVDDAILDGGVIDTSKLRPIGRLGGSNYSRTRDIIEMLRPQIDPNPPPKDP